MLSSPNYEKAYAAEVMHDPSSHVMFKNPSMKTIDGSMIDQSKNKMNKI